MEFERLLFKNWRAVPLFLYRRQDRMAIKALCIQRHRPLPETSQSSSGWGLRSGQLVLPRTFIMQFASRRMTTKLISACACRPTRRISADDRRCGISKLRTDVPQSICKIRPKPHGRDRSAIRGGEPACISAPKTAQKSLVCSVVPDFRLCFPERRIRLWTVSCQRKTDSSTQSNGVRARWFLGVR